MRNRTVALVTFVAGLVPACAAPAAVPSGAPSTTASVDMTTSVTGPASTARLFPPAPEVPSGPLDEGTIAAIDAVWNGLPESVRPDDIRRIGSTGDARVAWLIADLLRFAGFADMTEAGVDALFDLTGVRFEADVVWVAVTDHLIAWDLPAPPGYPDFKRRLFTAVDPRWEFVFAQPSDLDLRLLTWGGVFIDDRSPASAEGCLTGCIPALDDPVVTDAAGGDWYPDDGIVFGLVVNGEARAYPRHIMETHELVNDTLGGRRLGIPYCTLCGSAQAFYLDETDEFPNPVLRTSGLLARSNKVMYDLTSMSVFDTFTGRAVSGPMFQAGVLLRQETVVTSTWGGWKRAHPTTTVVAEDGGIGRVYDLDPLKGRDDQGPIFPIGVRDLRLPVHEQVLGAITEDGTAVAFPVAPALAALTRGLPVEEAGVRLALDGDGLRATRDGEPIPAHQAFWFAWSQFHPDSALWAPPG